MHQFDSLSVSPPVAQPVGGQARTGSYVARLNAGGSAPQPLGPLKQLAVQKGDTVTVTAPGYYPQPVQNSSFSFSLAGFVASLLQQPAQAPGADGRRRGALPLLSLGVSAPLAALTHTAGVPQGYVRLLVFDADSNLVSQQVQTQQLSAAANGGYEPLAVQVVAGQDGYVTAYVGNESNADVYFDDVAVTLSQGLQVQENSYDPYGLSLAGLDHASPGIEGLNQYQFNGKERQNELGLGWSDYGARMYDGQLGHWHSIDPMAEKMRRYSPYNYCFDNSVRFSDPDGMDPTDYYNIDGDRVKHVEDGKDDKKTVLTTRTSEKAVDKAIANGEVINTPTNENIAKMEESYNRTEADGDERGFSVGANGQTSKIVQGEGGKVDSPAWTEARQDLREKGAEQVYDVHTHTPPDGKTYGKAEPSDTDKGGMGSKFNVQPSIVLGYIEKSINDNPASTGASTTLGAPTTHYEHPRAIGIFGAKGPIGQPFEFDRFAKGVRKANGN